MPDFEEILRFLVLFSGVMGIIVGAGFGFKKLGQKPLNDPDLSDRVGDAERRVAELEERLDFAERVLAETRERVSLPPPQ